MNLTKTESRYVKMIYRKQRDKNKELNTSSIAEYLDVRPPSVTEVLQGLAEKKLLRYTPYHEFELTDEGVKRAEEQLRKHRILEVLLVKKLGYTPENACKEAFNLDYYASNQLINSICRNFNHPKTCPCGKEIFPDRRCREKDGDISHG